VDAPIPGFVPEGELERRLADDPELNEGWRWGAPRHGHPEGAVGRHVAMMLRAISPDDPLRADMRLLTLLHDTFKFRDEKRHPEFAARFAEAHGFDERMVETLRMHDAAYWVWHRKGGDPALLERVLARAPDRELLAHFIELDAATEGKDPGFLAWFRAAQAAHPGTSAVVIEVPAAEPVVSRWRAKFDASVSLGLPAHLTVLAPFLPQERLDNGVLDRLEQICASVPAQDVCFGHTARFPGVLYLEPEPDDTLRALTTAIARQWPEAPPYGGRFADVVPHLTVALGAFDSPFEAVEEAVQPELPIRARLDDACVYVYDGERWRHRARLPFAGAAPS
jgi:2'-5' RNA ligase